MEDLVERLIRGNVTEVKVVHASVAAALAVYQLVLAAVIYGRLRVPVLPSSVAAVAHRSIGDAIVVSVGVLIVVISIVVVTAHLGSTSVAELDAREGRIDARIDAREDALKAREDRIEERREALNDR